MAGGGGAPGEVNLNLTPMIDILTTLLFFLLLGYKSQAESVEGVSDVQLPSSISEQGLTVTVTVAVGMEAIKVEGQQVLGLREGKLADKDVKESKIVALFNAIQQILEQEKMNRIKVDKSAVLLAADRRLKSDVVVKVMKTCGMAGISNFRFAVSSE